MKDIKKIQEFFSKSLEENTAKAFDLQKGLNGMSYDVKVKYLDDFGKDVYEIYSQTPLDSDDIFFDAKKLGFPNVRIFDNMNEADLNDPVAMKMRAAKMRKANAGDDGNDPIFRDAAKLATLKKARKQLMRDMEQEAEPEGGPIADEYGSKLNRIDKAIAKLEGRKEMDYDTAVGKVSEAKVEFYQKGKKTFEKEFDTEEEANIFKAKAFDMADTSAVELKEYTGKISMPKFVKDKNNPNFLNVYIKYDTGAGATMALGRETGSGQDRRNNAAEAMKLANDVVLDLEAEYNIEDIDITDQENGIINIFAVSDDFVDMNPNMLGEAESEDKVDIVTMDVPLFIRALEYAKEDAQEDMDLHDFAERAITGTKEQGVLSMDDYDMLIGSKESLDEATPADDGIAAAGGGTPADQGRAADKADGLTTKTMNKILMNVIKDLKEGEPGLWDNIRAKKARGEKPSSKNSKAYKSAVAAGKRINKEK